MPSRRSRSLRNRILLALGRSDSRRVEPHLDPIALTLKQSLFEPGEPIPFVYFVEDGVVSLVNELDNGSIVEVATIGNEGIVGLPVFLGAASSPGRAFCQVAGKANRMRANVFRDVVSAGGALQPILNRYTQALFNQIAQSAACNRSHDLEQRCARWLLMTHDRVSSDAFHLTQEFLAQMLGVGRPRVNAAAAALQRVGCIRYVRGDLTVLDRKKLEKRACGCYDVIKAEYDRLLP